MGTKIAKNGSISAAIAHELHTTRVHGSEKLNRAGHYMRVVHYQRTSERHFWSFFLLGTPGSSPAVQGCILKCTPVRHHPVVAHEFYQVDRNDKVRAGRCVALHVTRVQIDREDGNAENNSHRYQES